MLFFLLIKAGGYYPLGLTISQEYL